MRRRAIRVQAAEAPHPLRVVVTEAPHDDTGARWTRALRILLDAAAEAPPDPDLTS